MALPTQRRLVELFELDPTTGALYWRTSGALAGTLTEAGYARVKVDGRNYYAHRLVWKWAFGKDPDGVLDHANGVRHDNRLRNIRDVTVSENNTNRRPSRRGRLERVLRRARQGGA